MTTTRGIRAGTVSFAFILIAAGCGDSDSDSIEAAASTPDTGNAVTQWAGIVAPAIHSTQAPRPPGSSFVLQAMIQLAVYDAVVAIKGGHEAFGTAIEARPDADLSAAVATAAYRTARGRVAETAIGDLEAKYTAYLAEIPSGAAKVAGVEVGEAAAADLLKLRADDGMRPPAPYACTADPPPRGEFVPDTGCGTVAIDSTLGKVRPFTFDDPARFRPDGPDSFTSQRWVKDFDEVKTFGGIDSKARTADQTDVVHFWAEHAFVHYNRNLNQLAIAKGLDVAQTARLMAMTYTAVADAAIAGFEAKYHFRTWRPRTAIPQAKADGNPSTAADPTWKPLLSVNHPEYPSGHSFATAALIEAVATFFGTDQVAWTLTTDQAAVPAVVRTQRDYANLNAILTEVSNARVWAGLHYRNTMTEGSALGTRVAEHALTDRFQPIG